VGPSNVFIRIGERVREVAIERRGDAVVARVDGREYRLSILEPQRGVYSFVPLDGGGPSVEAVVARARGGEAVFRVRVRGRTFEAAVERPDRRAGAPLPLGVPQEGRQVLRSAMPGRIVRVLAGPGTEVRRGQGLVVVEAMKMENELVAPKDGVVKEILVSPGDRVEMGVPLAVVE